jgi:hypothetical protein
MRRAAAHIIALGLQAWVVAAWLGAPKWATALLCLSAALLTWMCRSRFPLVLAFGWIAWRSIHWHSSPPWDVTASPEPRPVAVTKLYRPVSSGGVWNRRRYSGVILSPKANPARAKLTVPPRFSRIPHPLAFTSRTPDVIPFSGQYWMFRPPRLAPPPDSYFRKATPLAQSFLTTDQTPLSMRAIQKLDHPIDLECCRAIQVAIWNADRYPGTVSLELELIDTQAPGRPFESIGRRDVLSRPGIKPLDLTPIPAAEVLEFPVPSNAPIREFDAIQVEFERALFRADRSAAISIDHFALVP